MASAHAIPLETLAREAAFKLKRASEYRTSAAILLAECTRRVDEGDPEAHGAAWPEYCRVHFSSYPTHEIDRLIEDSAPADDQARQVDRAPRTDAFDRAWAAFTALDVADQRDFLRCGAAFAIHPEDASGRTGTEPAVEAPRVLDWLA